MEKITIGLAADHAGFYMKDLVLHYLQKEGYNVKDYGTFSGDDVDYPDFAHPLATSIEQGVCSLGFIFCGTGNGVNMTVNKHQSIRSGVCWNTEIARLIKAHNNANVCAIPARFISENEALNIVKTFLSTTFEGGRHQRRVNKISIQK